MRNKTTSGVIVGNRCFFPDHLCQTGRREVLRVLEEVGIGAVALKPEATPFGSVASLEDAKKCAALFKQHADGIDGILVSLPIPATSERWPMSSACQSSTCRY